MINRLVEVGPEQRQLLDERVPGAFMHAGG